jgi:hypothetical protein
MVATTLYIPFTLKSYAYTAGNGLGQCADLDVACKCIEDVYIGNDDHYDDH